MSNGNTVTWKVVACAFGTIIIMLFVGSVGYILNDLQKNDEKMTQNFETQAANLNALITTVNRLAQHVEDTGVHNQEKRKAVTEMLQEQKRAIRELERKIGP